MTIGEIKSEALRLSFPDPQLYMDTSDKESVSAAISSLKEDPNYSDFLEASVGSINRALSEIERRGLSPLVSRAVTSTLDDDTGMIILDVSAFQGEMLFVEGVYEISDGALHSVQFENGGGGKLFLSKGEKNQRCIIKYRTVIQRISSVSSDGDELPLSTSLASSVPYFIKGDLLSSEDPSASEQAMALFDRACIAHPTVYAEQGSVISVYRQEEIM